MSASDKSKPGTREARLKVALRDNLRRRKAQARGRAGAEASALSGDNRPEGTDDSSPPHRAV